MYARLNPKPLDLPTPKLHGISLSTGYGGLDKALLMTVPNLEFLAVCDIEIFPQANLISKMEKGLIPTAPIWTDITTFPYSAFEGKVDLLCAGFPCQPFSSASKDRASTDSFKYLWEHIIRGVHQLGKPSILFFENVKNMLHENLRSDIEGTVPGISDSFEGMNVTHHMACGLQELGYKVAIGLFSATEVGCVTPRPRTFILGILDTCPYNVVASLKASECVNRVEDNFSQVIETLVDNPQERTIVCATANYPESLYTEDFLELQFESLQAQNPKFQFAAPAPVGEPQLPWEPPRAVRKDEDPSNRPWDSLEDESRMIGNGVIPQEAYHAFCVLFNQLLGR